MAAAWWTCVLALAVGPGDPGPHLVGKAAFRAAIPGDPPPRRAAAFLCRCWFPRAPSPFHYGRSGSWELLEQARPAPGPWPVVLFSHGLAAAGDQSESLCEHWASHGFVVLAVDHPATTGADLRFFSILESVRNRPRELAMALDVLAEESEQPRSPWHGAIDARRVAAVGHSMGGCTALALGGALLDTSRFPRLGPMPPANRAEPLDRRDPRVRCVVAFTPATEPFFRDESLRSLRVPTLVIDGTRDPITPRARHGDRVFRGAGGPREQVVIDGAAHVSFMDPWLVPRLPWAVRAQHWPALPDTRVEQLVRAATTSFLDRQLRGGKFFPDRPQAPELVWRVAP